MQEHRHLIQEIKDELEWATREGSNTERTVMDLEIEYNRELKRLQEAGDEDAIKALMAEKEKHQENCRLGEIFAIQRRAARRFSLISRAYELACAERDKDTLREALGGFLFRSSDDLRTIEGAAAAVHELTDALYDYFHVSFDDDNDDRVRGAWLHVEEALKSVGREI